MNKQILILGAGVSGLSSAILLMKKGYPVVIWTKNLPPNTTSNKAAAIWHPYLSYPRDKVIVWAKATYEYIHKEIIHDPMSGCRIRTTTEIFDCPQPSPWWKDGFPGKIIRPTKEDLPQGYIDGYRIQSIVINTSFYMAYLLKIFKSLGGILIKKEIEDIREALHEHSLIVNCTGMGSKQLFNDTLLYPIRGQTVRIKATNCNEAIIDDHGPNKPSLVVPRVNDIILGGTAQVNNWTTKINPKDTEAILKRTKLIAPKLKNIEIIEISVGLRPARETVRLEIQNFGEKTIVHNYGHGGSGFTLSWGCAQNVVDLIEKSV